MKRFSILFLAITAATAVVLPGCFSITRTETDLYTITRRDTTIREDVRNEPGGRDGGTVYPSPREIDIHRRYVQQDSIVDRYYPAFLRFGGIETASFITPGGSTSGGGLGLFSLYDLLTAKHPEDSKIFTASMFRFVPYEWRLRWFEDAPNWTFGTAAFEMFTQQKDSSATLSQGEVLMGILPFYVRKRIFFREEPPYIMLVPFFGFSYYPSQYVNLGATLDIGSYGGFNVRAYAGVVTGGWSLFGGARNSFFQSPDSLGTVDIPSSDFNVTYPYFGIGVSALDFVNKTEELFIEWKDHDHSAIEVDGLNVDIVKSLSGGRPFLSTAADTGSAPITGTIMRLATATYPLPFGNHRFFVGTSLFNLIALSSDEIAISFLPIRAGYRHNLLEDNLNLEPFIELNYYPSQAIHAGARLALKVTDWMQINAVGGFVYGTPNLEVLSGLEDLKATDNFSTGYVGIGFGIGDVFHTPEEVLRR